VLFDDNDDWDLYTNDSNWLLYLRLKYTGYDYYIFDKTCYDFFK
jgi:hypothetical protein